MNMTRDAGNTQKTPHQHTQPRTHDTHGICKARSPVGESVSQSSIVRGVSSRESSPPSVSSSLLSLHLPFLTGLQGRPKTKYKRRTGRRADEVGGSHLHIIITSDRSTRTTTNHQPRTSPGPTANGTLTLDSILRLVSRYTRCARRRLELVAERIPVTQN